MTLALLVMTDGRFELLEKTLRSFREQVVGGVSCVFIHDDSADPPFREWLATHVGALLPPNAHGFVKMTGERQGFGGAIRSAWNWLAECRRGLVECNFDFVFHLEDDFTFNDRVSLNTMMALLYEQPHLAQLALKRQPWGSDLEAGGFMKAAPDWYVERYEEGIRWVETGRNWTTNPAMYRADILDVGWPDDPHSEGKFGFVLKEQGLPWGVTGGDVRFGFLGGIDDPPLVHHIGDYRVGDRY